MKSWMESWKKLSKLQTTAEKDLKRSIKVNKMTSLNLDCIEYKKEGDDQVMMKHVYRMLEACKMLNKVDNVSKCKVEIEKLENNISSTRVQISTTLIDLEERNRKLGDEITSLLDDLKQSMQTQVDDDLSKMNYGDFIKRYGKCGGWGYKEHQYYVMNRARDDFVDLISEKYGMSRDEVIKHDKWYNNFIKAKQRHEESVLLWKELKRNRKDQHLVEDRAVESTIVRKTQEEEEREKLKRDEIQEKILKWKKEKLKEDMERKQKEMESKQRDRERRELRRISLKQKLREKVIQKNNVEPIERKKIIVDCNKLREKSEKELERIKQRVEQRKTDMEQQEQSQREKLEKLIEPIRNEITEKLKQREKVELHKAKTQQTDLVREEAFFSVSVIPRRQVPSWRRN